MFYSVKNEILKRKIFHDEIKFFANSTTKAQEHKNKIYMYKSYGFAFFLFSTP